MIDTLCYTTLVANWVVQLFELEEVGLEADVAGLELVHRS